VAGGAEKEERAQVRERSCVYAHDVGVRDLIIQGAFSVAPRRAKPHRYDSQLLHRCRTPRSACSLPRCPSHPRSGGSPRR
jgi:hypothetical protein